MGPAQVPAEANPLGSLPYAGRAQKDHDGPGVLSGIAAEPVVAVWVGVTDHHM